MISRRALAQYAVAAVLFLVVDLLWIGVVSGDLYQNQLGDLLADQPNALAAGVFYALFVAGLVHFVIGPATRDGSLRRAAVDGAAFGLVTYATWDLTSLAVIDGFPATLALIDMTWGAVLALTVSTGTFAVWQRYGDRLS